jgi:hypothetical protein
VRKDTGIWGTPQFQHMCMTILCGVGIRPLIISTSTGFPQVPRSNPTSPEGNLGNGSNGGGRLSMPERPADVLWYTNMLSWPTTLGRNDLRCTTFGSQGLCAPNSRVVCKYEGAHDGFVPVTTHRIRDSEWKSITRSWNLRKHESRTPTEIWYIT